MPNETIASPEAHELSAVKGPKALFWFLTQFFALGVTAFSSGGLWFQFINKWFPTEIIYGQAMQPFSQNVLKMQIASLLVAVPVFVILSVLIRRALVSGLLDVANKVRLWITYIILFATVAIAVGDLIRIVFSLLNGDFTARFLLKAAVVLMIVCWIFIYYWLEIRSVGALKGSRFPKIAMIVSLVVVIASFLGSFLIVESPMQARRNAFDNTRVNDLQQIKYATDDYYREYGKLPATLDALKTARAYIKIVDSKGGQPYDYAVKGKDKFELCADFETSNKIVSPDDAYKTEYMDFLHDVGHVCFAREVSKDLGIEKMGQPLSAPTMPSQPVKD